MTVRRQKFKCRDGTTKEPWMVDIVFEHPDGRKERIRKVSPVQNKRGAEQYERELRISLLEGRKEQRKEVLFKNFAEEFQEVYCKAEVKWATQIAYESTIRVHLVPEFGNRHLDEIQPQNITRFKARLRAKGLSASTIRNTLGVLSRIFHIAKEWGYLKEVPSIAFPKVPTPSFRYLSENEIQKLLSNASDYWYGSILFALMTGCRQGEIWALERDQIDLENNLVIIDRAVYRGVVGLPKHDKIRKIEIPRSLSLFLEDHLKVVPLKTSLVFPNTNGDMRLKRKADVGLRRAAIKADLKPFGWHVLRHTYASQLALKLVPVQVIQQLLGHSRIDETMRYAHLSPHMRRDAVAKLDGLNAINADLLRQNDGKTLSAVG